MKNGEETFNLNDLTQHFNTAERVFSLKDRVPPVIVFALTNSIEGFSGSFKRRITGAYHHVGKGASASVLGEFDFR